MGNYIKLLKGEKFDGQQIDPTAKVSDRVTGLLGYFKEEFRNPLMHPELTLSDDDAMDLFQAVLSSISAMVADIIDRRNNRATR